MIQGRDGSTWRYRAIHGAERPPHETRWELVLEGAPDVIGPQALTAGEVVGDLRMLEATDPRPEEVVTFFTDQMVDSLEQRAAQLEERGRSSDRERERAAGLRSARLAEANAQRGRKDEQPIATAHFIDPSGDPALYSLPRVQARIAQLIATETKHVVVDLAEATFIDGATSDLLGAGLRRLRSAGCSISLVFADENVAEILEITGLIRFFSIYGSREEALAAVRETECAESERLGTEPAGSEAGEANPS